MKTVLFFALACLLISASSSAQQASYFDPAQAYNRLLIEKNSNSYTRVSRYKVIGSSYLFGERHPGHLFAKGETALNIKLSYNTHTQEVEFYSSANPDKALVKDPEEVDSFVLRANPELGITEDLNFINGKHLNASDKQFYQIVYSGPKCTLYKMYKTSLGIVTTNYVDADLRQFEMEYEFYYRRTGEKGIKRIKPNQKSVSKEFKEVKDIDTIIGENSFSYNPEAKLKLIFISLNN